MSIDEAEFKKLKHRAEAARQARDKASGQLDAAMERLQTEFGCNTIEEAEAKATKLKREAEKAETAYHRAVKEFEEQWDDRLEN